MSQRCIVVFFMAMGLLTQGQSAFGGTGTTFNCTVRGEADIKIYMDQTGHSISLEQNGVMSPDVRERKGAFRTRFAGGSYVFVMSQSSHGGTIRIVRSQRTRTGQCI